MHRWQFLSAEDEDDSPLVIAVCSACGLTRATTISTRGKQHIDLRGECPGEPQEPEPLDPEEPEQPEPEVS